ncbi:MAG: hypothetical protein ABI200_04585 [Gaiellales bacterium]
MTGLNDQTSPRLEHELDGEVFSFPAVNAPRRDSGPGGGPGIGGGGHQAVPLAAPLMRRVAHIFTTTTYGSRLAPVVVPAPARQLTPRIADVFRRATTRWIDPTTNPGTKGTS